MDVVLHSEQIRCPTWLDWNVMLHIRHLRDATLCGTSGDGLELFLS